MNAVLLCGTMFQGLNTVRHRKFECNPIIAFAPAKCCHTKKTAGSGRKQDWSKYYMMVTGHFSGVDDARLAMGLPYMTGKELTQPIPPHYTEYLGRKMLQIAFNA